MHLAHTIFGHHDGFVGWRTAKKRGRVVCCACGPCANKARTISCAVSQILVTGRICKYRCCCKVKYREGRMGRRAIKRDYDAILQRRDDLTQRPGWRANAGLLSKVREIQEQCVVMRAEIQRRKLAINTAEEVMLGTVEYCHMLERRKAAFEWLMDAYPNWKGVPPKRQRSWKARIKTLRKKVNTGAAGTVHRGKVNRLKRRKRRLESTARALERRWAEAEKWKQHEGRLKQDLRDAKSQLADVRLGGRDAVRRREVAKKRAAAGGGSKVHHEGGRGGGSGGDDNGDDGDGVSDELVDILFGRAKQEASRERRRAKKALERHRQILDEESKMLMKHAYVEIMQKLVQEKASGYSAVLQVNLALAAATHKVNLLRAYREDKFQQAMADMQNLHGEVDQETAEDATQIVAPPLTVMPKVFWPHDVYPDRADKPSEVLVLRWYDPSDANAPLDPHHLIHGYRLTVLCPAQAGGGGAADGNPGAGVEGAGVGDASFQQDWQASRDQILHDDPLLVREDMMKHQDAEHLLGEAEDYHEASAGGNGDDGGNADGDGDLSLLASATSKTRCTLTVKG